MHNACVTACVLLGICYGRRWVVLKYATVQVGAGVHAGAEWQTN